MGQISGINASSITNIAGVQVANISYVGPITASAIGLGGGGGLIMTVDFWFDTSQACINGASSILESGYQTLYLNPENNTFYTDSSYTSVYSPPADAYFWSQTNNSWYFINGKGGNEGNGSCGGGNTGKTFAYYNGWGEPGQACSNGPAYIDKGGETIVLYYNQEQNRVYTDAGFETALNGGGFYWWDQTDNQWWQINEEGYVVATGNCG
jgi:hypothetical protein